MPLERISDHTLLTTFLSADSVVLDLGANHGNFSSQIRERFKSRMYLVEANPALIDELSSQFTDVLHAAASSKEGEITFNVSDNDEGSSLLDLPEESDFAGKLENTVTVKTYPFKKLLDHFQLDHIHLLKIDIEGAETELLVSIDAENLDRIDQITVEFHCMHSFGYNLVEATNKTIQYLEQNGFVYFEVSMGKKVDAFFLNQRFINEKGLSMMTLRRQVLTANLGYVRRQLGKKYAAFKRRS